eukprot:gene13065-9355_t
MYGWINNCLEDMVISNYGLDQWELIKEVAGCFVPTGDFILSVHYDDELTYSLIAAAAKVLGHTTAETWEIYGRHFIHFLEANHYSGTLRGQGKTLRDWIQNINEPHRLLRARYPQCTLPEFWSENDASDVTGESILLHYYTPRTGGLASCVIGMCKEASRVYFDKELEMEFVREEEFDWTTEQTAAGSNFRHHSVWRLRNVGKELSYESLSSNDSLVASPCPPPRRAKGAAPPTAPSAVCADIDESLSVADLAAAAGCPFHRKSPATAKPSATVDRLLQLQPPAASQSPQPLEPQGETLSLAPDASPPQGPRAELLLRVPPVAGYSLGPRAFKRLFPFHIIVNRRMEIVQLGNKLNDFVERAQLPPLLGTHIADAFSLCVTDRFPWTWAGLKKLANQATITLHSVQPAARALKLVGEVTLLDDDRRHRRRRAAWFDQEDDEEKDEAADGGGVGVGGGGEEEQEVVAALLVNPVVSDMLALLAMGFDLSDLPRHSFQRDVLQMEEHLKTELNNTVRMTQLSKHLEHESKKSIDALKMKRIFVRYVSHEIRTPLNKIDDGIFSLAQAPLSLRGFVCEAAKLFRMQAKGSGVRFVILGNVFTPPRRAPGGAECRKRRRRHSTGSTARARLLRTADADDEDAAAERDAYHDVYHDDDAAQHDAHAAAEADEAFFADARYGDRVVVSADKAKLHQVLRNLFTNAIKFTPQHGLIALSCDVVTFPRATATEALRGVEEDKRPDAADEATGGDADDAATSAEEKELRRLRAALATVAEDAITFDGVLLRPTPPPPPPPAPSALLSPSRSFRGDACASPITGGQRSRANSVTSVGSSASLDAASAALHRPPSLVLPATSAAAAAAAAGPSRFLRIAVTDSGCGISREDQRQLFHEFIQVKADKLQNGQGSGLGLWIAANLMKMHGGRIGVFSPGEGRGTTFVMDLPCDVEPLPDATLPPPAAPLDPQLLRSPGHVAIARLDRLSRSSSLAPNHPAPHGHRRDNSIVLETLLAAPSPPPVSTAAAATANAAAAGASLLRPRSSPATGPAAADRSAIGHRLRYNSASPHHSSLAQTPRSPSAAAAEPLPLPSPFPSGVTTPAADAASCDVSAASSTKIVARGGCGCAAIETPALPPLAPPTSTRDARVLVVDDAPSNRKMVKRVLGLHYGTVDDAENGAQAVASIDRAFRAAGADDVLLKPLNLAHCNEAFARFYRLALPER